MSTYENCIICQHFDTSLYSVDSGHDTCGYGMSATITSTCGKNQIVFPATDYDYIITFRKRGNFARECVHFKIATD